MTEISAPASILLVHYHYPPMRNSGVHRNYRMSHAFASLGLAVDVITTSNIYRLPSDHMPPHPGVTVHSAFTFDYRTVTSWMSPRSDSGAQFTEERKNSWLRRWILRLQRSFPFHLFLAEGNILYILSAFLKARHLIKKNHTRIVYTSFMPYADHWVGWCLKKSMPHLIWIADFRDLHAEPIYKNVIWPGMQRAFEGRLLRNATFITAVSKGIAVKMEAIHPVVKVVTKGIHYRPWVKKYDSFTIAYTGSLFQDFRDPGPFFSALHNLMEEGKIDREDIRFVYAGKDGSRMMQLATEHNVYHCFTDKGYLPHTEACEVQDRSHVNLLLTTATQGHTGMLTGKLFEYLEARTPIVCIVNGGMRDVELEDTIFANGNGFVAYVPPIQDTMTIREAILSLYNAWKVEGHTKPSDTLPSRNTNTSWDAKAKIILDGIH